MSIAYTMGRVDEQQLAVYNNLLFLEIYSFSGRNIF